MEGQPKPGFVKIEPEQIPISEFDISGYSSDLQFEQQSSTSLLRGIDQPDEQTVKAENPAIIEKYQPSLPRLSEIQRSFQVLKQVLPNYFTAELIDTLYLQIVKVYSSDQATSRDSLIKSNGNINSTENVNQKNTIFSSNSKPQPILTRSQVSPLKNSNNKRTAKFESINKKGLGLSDYTQENKTKLQKAISISFCKYGSDYQKFLQYINSNNMSLKADHFFYEDMIKLIAIKTLNYLEQFLSQPSEYVVQLCSIFQEKDVIDIIVNCKSSLSSQMSQIVHNIILLQCGASSKEIYFSEAFSLHQQLEKILKNNSPQACLNLDSQTQTKVVRRKSKPYIYCAEWQKGIYNNNKKTQDTNTNTSSYYFQLDKIWNDTYQEQLIKIYKEVNALSPIRQHFKAFDPQKAHLFTIAALKSRLYRILRMALKKLYFYINTYGKNTVPQIVKLDDPRIKSIISSKTARKARYLLLGIYQAHNYSQKEVRDTIEAINQEIQMGDKRANKLKKTVPNQFDKMLDAFRRN